MCRYGSESDGARNGILLQSGGGSVRFTQCRLHGSSSRRRSTDGNERRPQHTSTGKRVLNLLPTCLYYFYQTIKSSNSILHASIAPTRQAKKLPKLSLSFSGDISILMSHVISSDMIRSRSIQKYFDPHTWSHGGVVCEVA